MQIGWFRGKKKKQKTKAKQKKQKTKTNFTCISTTTAELFFSANKNTNEFLLRLSLLS